MFEVAVLIELWGWLGRQWLMKADSSSKTEQLAANNHRQARNPPEPP
jgi:hypothetical protein